MSRSAFCRVFVFALMIVLFRATRGFADAPALFDRLPPGANCIVYIDVDSLLRSKIGVKEDWRGRMSDAYATKPLVVPPNAKSVVMASWIEPAGMNPVWEVSLIEVAKPISMERIARDENGFTDSLGGKMAAWSPINALFVRLDSKLLGVVCPDNRQFAARWIAPSSSGVDVLSPYLRAAAGDISPKTSYLFALDLQDAVSEKRVRRRLDLDEFDCLTDKKLDKFKVSESIASVKGLKLTVDVQSGITGKCVIEFGKPVSVLASLAQPLLLEILENTGASIEDFGSWKFTSDDASITASGSLSTEGLRQLFSIIEPPSPTVTDEDASDAEKPAATASPQAVAAASKRYFQAVSKIVDGFGKRVRTATSLTKGATYIARDARAIGRLPILNVDPDLLNWGADVSSSLVAVASGVGVGGLNARARAESILNPNKNGAFSNNYEIHSDPNDEVNRQNAARERRAAVAEEKSKVLQQATQLLMQLETGRSQLRAAMTKKYNIEF